jgi:CPA2 family monovalent cation:H+ antiporter-2
MHEIDLILTLTGGLAAALICGYITFRLGLSPIVGYLLAGFVVGPHTPGFVADTELADQLAEIGIILLMFGAGLQFHLEELLAVGRIAAPGALCGSLAATLLGTFVGVSCGWSWSAGVVFGLAISVASTVVLMRVLADRGDLHTPPGHIAVGWLVVEDLFTVLVLVLLPAIFRRGEAGAGAGTLGLMIAVVFAVVKVAAMVGLTIFGGRRLIPWLLAQAASTRSRELFTLTVLVVALGIAVGSVKLFGVSMALGAFLAGMVVGRSEFSLRAATEALPMRDAFAVLFFVSVGMLFDPHYLITSPGLTAGTLAVILLGKPVVALVLVRLLGHPLRTATAVAVALAQIGEFSFILAAAGKHLGILDDRAVNAIVAGAIITITVNPLLYRLARPLASLLRRFIKEPPGSGVLVPDVQAGDGTKHDRAVVIGYGPVGRTLARLLRENQIEPVVIELNLETVRRLGAEGIMAVYGDAAHPETLKQAGLGDARALILSSSQTLGSREAIRVARELNPKVFIAARSSYLHELSALRAAGADLVFSEEVEVALSMTESLLERLGATPEQIDRERARIRSDLCRGTTDHQPSPDDRPSPKGDAGPTDSSRFNSDRP